MKTSIRTLLLGFAAVLALGAATFAAVPRTINYQGYLKGSAGTPVNSATSMTFSLYSTVNGAGPVWGSGVVSVTPVNGIYSVELGKSPQPPLDPPFDRQYWLGVQVGTDPEMRPLQPLTSAPYAIRALEAGAVPDGSVTVTKLADGSVTAAKLDTAYVKKTGDNMSGALNLPANGLAVGTNQLVVSGGNVGIGAASSLARLSVSASGFISDYIGTGSWGVLRFLEGATPRSYLGYGDTGGFMINSLADSTGLRAVTGALHLAANVDATKGMTIIDTGNIGIGTNTPASRLHLKGASYPDSFIFLDTTAAAQDSGMRFLENGVTKSHLYWSAANQTLRLLGSGDAGLDISSAGNLGIGTATPLYKLHAINTVASNDNPAVYGDHSVTDNFGVGVTGKGGWKGVFGTVSGTGSGSYRGVHGVATSTNSAAGTTYGGYFSASGALNNYGIYVSAAKNYFSGDVGLGTTTPGARLHLKGSNYPDSFMFLDTTAAAQDSGLRFLENGVTKSHLFWLASAQTLALRGSGYAGIDITSTGNVGIGTTAPAQKLHVWGDFLRVEGAGGEQAYIGGDGAGGDVQIGSMNAAISNVAMYNTATNAYMSVYLKNVHVMGGADLAEPFNSSDADRLEPGMVMAIDSDNPGQLVLAASAYDTRVAGIVSGANGISAGMTMAQQGTLASGSVPVALSGRVYAWADASYGEIRPGDLLTTSDSLGHAMKVSDHSRAQGAIIGKAMSRLSSGKGLVLVLVTLQ